MLIMNIEADYFAKNNRNQSPYSVVILHKVLVGKRAELKYKETGLRQPPTGTHSVRQILS